MKCTLPLQWIGSLCLMASVTAAFASSPLSGPHKEWSVSLAGDSDWSGAKRTIDINSYRAPQVEFLDDKTIAVTFMHSVNKPEPQRQSDRLEPVFLKALMFDSLDGHLYQTLQWMARRDAGKLLPVHGGAFLVHAGDKIKHYSPDFKLLLERDLVPPAQADPNPARSLSREWVMKGTPGGRMAVLRFHESHYDTDIWISADTLEDIFSDRPEHPGRGIFAEDARIAWENVGVYPNASSKILLWERGKGWREIPPEGGGEVFLADNQLLLSRFRQEFKVVDRNGKVIFRGPLSQADPSNLLVKRNLDGTRFAINDSHRAIPLVQKRDFFDWNFEVKIGDVRNRKLVAQIGLGTHDSRQIDIALSPDGSHLAVLAESTLSLYDLP